MVKGVFIDPTHTLGPFPEFSNTILDLDIGIIVWLSTTRGITYCASETVATERGSRKRIGRPQKLSMELRNLF
jgi:hypothetical protein